MNLSVSNIAWGASADTEMYRILGDSGYTGLEIAPTRIFADFPYERSEEAKDWAVHLRRDCELSIPSMQSIWYGRQERLFGSREERETLLAYTERAIDFAAAIGCGNLVFGCPKNRVLPEDADADAGIGFFRHLAEYAAGKKAMIGMEANPPMYGTNYINTTAEALALVREVDSAGFRLNLDVGTMLANSENAHLLQGQVHLVSHVHISEPGLRPIKKRPLHRALAELLKQEGYTGYVSIEMGRVDDLKILADAMAYVREVFRDA